METNIRWTKTNKGDKMPGKEYPNRFARLMEKPEVERLVGFRFDIVDNLKVKNYGNTQYVYEEKNHGGHSNNA